MKFTFKRHPYLTGLQSVANPYPAVDIKLNKKIIGFIVPPNALGSENWYVWFRLKNEDKKSNCTFRNVKLKGEWSTEEEARAYLQKHASALIAEFHFVPEED